MANTNIMTGYTYTPVIVFLQVLPRLKCPVSWAKDLASPNIVIPLLPRCMEADNNNNLR